MSVTLHGLDDVIDDLRGAKAVLRAKTDDMLHDIGRYTVGRAKAYIMDAGAVDLGELVQGVHDEYQRTSNAQQVTIRPSDEADRYAAFVEYGTRPHTPPVSALQGWADRHGIPVWLVVRKIQREGTEPRFMWRDTFDDLQEHAEKRTRIFAEELVRGI